ncbi:MAG TPA: DUF3500 domain-containing protein [Geminicoccaceae bacterium]|nr:DUF3500 domain-containing protein [Geminicoccaceae bacterium]
MARQPSAEVRTAVPWAAAAALGERMTAAAAAFAETLDAPQRPHALHRFDGAARRDWGYTPRARPGLPLRAMREAQRKAAWTLVDAALSAEGAAKARGVLALEAILQEREANRAYRDPENYALALFGEPGRGPWAWRFEGHHVSLTLTVVPGIGVAVTPHFFGANPFSGQVVPDGHGGLARVLERESALAFAVLGGLGPAQRREAVIAAEAPPDFTTRPGREDSLREPVGLPLDAMPAAERERATALLDVFFDHLHPELAEPIKRRVREAGLGAIRFAWAGAETPDRLHYYRLHGPTLLIEYDKTDLDHAHSVWHDPTDLFGEDHLRAHHEAAHAHR